MSRFWAIKLIQRKQLLNLFLKIALIRKSMFYRFCIVNYFLGFQITQLEKRFQTQHYLTAGERIHFARQLNLSVLQVYIIFKFQFSMIITKL